MWVHGTKRKGRIHLVLEAFPPNIYVMLVFVVCPKELLTEVNRLVIFVSQTSSEDRRSFGSNTLLGRGGGGDPGRVKGGMGTSHFLGGGKGRLAPFRPVFAIP